MEKKVRFIVILALLGFLVTILPGTVLGYSGSISPNGKTIMVNFNNVPSTLHFDVKNTIKSGIYGKGKYTDVMQTGTDNQGRTSYMKISYFNNNFKQSRLILTGSDGFLYSTISTRTGSKIFERIVGKVDKISFNGVITGILTAQNGQTLHKSASGTIKYWENGVYYGKTVTSTTPYYRNYSGKYKMIKTATISNTYYANHDTRISGITSIYLRDVKGTQTGLSVKGTSRGSEKVGKAIVKYNGKIYIQSRHDPRDLYNEKFNTGNYKEVRTSTSTTLNNKRIPIFEALLY